MKLGDKYTVPITPELDPGIPESWIRKVNVLLKASMVYSLQMELSSALKVLVDLATDIAPSARVVFYVLDEEDKKFYPAVTKGFPEGIPETLRTGNMLLTWTVENNLPIRIQQPDNQGLIHLFNSLRCQSGVSLPISFGERTHGILQLFSEVPGRYTVEDVRLLWILSLQMEGLLHRSHQAPFLHSPEADPLTGLLLWPAFEKELSREVTRARRGDRSLSLLLMEVDRLFSAPEQGPTFNTEVLVKEIAESLKTLIRDTDTLSRSGQAGFALILPETDLTQAVLLANRIRTRVSSSQYHSLPGSPRPSLSVGTASFPQAAAIPDLVQAAQKALHTAQEKGGNRVESPAAPPSPAHSAGPVAVEPQHLLDTFNRFFHMDRLLDQLVEFFSRVTGAERVSILVLDETGQHLLFRHGIGFSGFEEEVRRLSISLETSVSGRVLKSRRPVLVENADETIPGRPRHRLGYSTASFMSLPLVDGDMTVGVLNFSNKRGGRPFTREDLEKVTPHAAGVTRLLSEGRRFSRAQEGFFQSTADILLGVAENKSPYLTGHSHRVSSLVEQLAPRLGLKGDEIRVLADSARLHDLGFLVIDEGVMGKRGILEENEKALIQQHPVWTCRILGNLPGMKLNLDAIRSHHERYDGKGYPAHLLGEEIPLGGRIIAVADAFDAMTSPRPFRTAISPAEAIRTLEAKSWSQFDGRVVKAFKDLPTLH